MTTARASQGNFSSSPQVAAGLPWAVASLALDIVEVLVLTEIIFFDKRRSGFNNGFGFLEFYFAFTLAGTIGQLIGVYLVTRGWYRSGGIMQIVSSATQVIKIDGIIGVIGGIKAYRYGVELAGPISAAQGARTSLSPYLSRSSC